MTPSVPAEEGIPRQRSSHLLAGCSNIARGFDDALAAVVVFVEFGAERLEHWKEGRRRATWWLRGI